LDEKTQERSGGKYVFGEAMEGSLRMREKRNTKTLSITETRHSNAERMIENSREERRPDQMVLSMKAFCVSDDK
jgi:hypothetical protein